MARVIEGPMAPAWSSRENRRGAVQDDSVVKAAADARGQDGSSPGLRLTLRGKLVLVLAVCLLPFLALTAGRALAAPEPAGPPAVVTVEPGETLWGLALRVTPEGDPRETMASLMTINDLETSELYVGQQLMLPRP